MGRLGRARQRPHEVVVARVPRWAVGRSHTLCCFAWIVASGLAACGGAPPSGPTAPSDLALLGEADDGHFLPPERPDVPAALRQRIGRRGPSRPRLARRPLRRSSAPPHASRENNGLRARQRVDAAAALLGTRGLRRRAFVDHVLHASGATIRVDPAVPYAGALWTALRAKRRKRPRRGDVVFFRDTLDLNHNGRPDDGVTWAAIVERVAAGRVLFIGQRAGKVRRMSLFAARPALVRDAAGRVRNTRLVRWPGDPRPRTAGQCVAGYARP